ncbi:hypothetical protein AGROH133_14522 (plasmid) [Agrobacterium tumefaciens]|nr:hypothetical protein AGROH133_14522 [Agrobacterium tumefaciens]
MALARAIFSSDRKQAAEVIRGRYSALDPIVCERCHEACDEIARLLFDENLGPLVGSPQHQPGVDTVDGSLAGTPAQRSHCTCTS